MDENRKNAYRYLLYKAMLDIRTSYWKLSSMKLSLIIKYPRMITARRNPYMSACLAEWLHNLALFACDDFQGFNEDLFWTDCEQTLREFPELREQYKNVFEGQLTR